MDSHLLNALYMYRRLQSRSIHPEGKFDNAGRWHPTIEYECCKAIRQPSRAFPYSLQKHCRSIEHVANACNVDVLALRRLARAKSLDALR